MNVLFLRPQPAIRSLKYALAFKHADADICLYHGYTAKTLTELYGSGDECFSRFVHLGSGRIGPQIRRLVDDLAIDLIHSQNAPDLLTRAAVEATDEIPIIHENQDVISLRQTPYTPEGNLEQQLEDERIANQMSDARIHVSQGLLDYIRSKYGPKREIVFHNYVSRSLVPRSFKPKLSERDGNVHIVYEGTLSSFLGDHYDLREIFTDLSACGYHVHIYDSHSNPDYRHLAMSRDSIHYHGHRDPKQLPYEMTQYDYGWAGFNIARNKEHMDVALPNKLFEYLASGLPVLSFPHKAQREFIEANNVGVVFQNIGELDDCIKDHLRMDRIKSRVLKKRRNFTMEAHIDRIINLYESLLEETN